LPENHNEQNNERESETHAATSSATAPTSNATVATRRRQRHDDQDYNDSDDDDEENHSPQNLAAKRARKRRKDMAVLKKSGWEKWIGTEVRLAVFDAAPFWGPGKPLPQHLYWANTPPEACAFQFIKRTPRLQQRALALGVTLPEFAVSLASEITLHSRKARNKHIYELKALFFNDNSEFQCARHVLNDNQVDEHGTPLPMELLPFLNPSLMSAKDLSNLLMSPDMHANPVFYGHFVAALGSGKLTKIKKQKVTTPLTKFIALEYEAHFRLELWYSLTKSGD
jgi:hypothetical protein